jgi:two-component system, LytTR family, sensor histidine kinase AlgZ
MPANEPDHPALALVVETVRGLLAPRRLIPILVVSVPLLMAQAAWGNEPLDLPIGMALCLAFVLVAPVSWRLLFPEGVVGARRALPRLLAYTAIGLAIVLGLGWAVPKMLDAGPMFLTLPLNLAVSVTLFLVGGWGLGRDIGFEVSLSRERARAAALAREAERAQLLALRAHLDPHFLFNTLNCIAEWCREDGEVAERAVLQLADMLRAILAGVQADTWPLGEELGLVRTLFGLHQMRDPDLFKLVVEVDQGVEEFPVPPMILMSLAENAVKHGPAAGFRGEIRLRASRQPDRLCLRLENPGAYRGPREGSNGLPTVERRLALAYGAAARFTIGALDECRTVAEIQFALAPTAPKEPA